MDTLHADKKDFNNITVQSRGPNYIIFKGCYKNVSYKNAFNGKTINCPSNVGYVVGGVIGCIVVALGILCWKYWPTIRTRAGLSISETADLLGFSCTIISRVYREWSEKESGSSVGANALLMPEGIVHANEDDFNPTTIESQDHTYVLFRSCFGNVSYLNKFTGTTIDCPYKSNLYAKNQRRERETVICLPTLRQNACPGGFSLRVRVLHPRRPYPPKKSGGKLNSAQTTEVKDRSADVKKKFGDTKKEAPTGPTCLYCKKPGHVLSECLILQRKREKGPSPNALVKSVTEMPIEFGSCESFCPYDAKKAESSDLLREEFLPFVSEGFVSPSENSPSQPIRILRDTGASQSLLLKEALPSFGNEDKAIGDFILVQGIEGRIVTVPLHSVFLKSDLVTGQVKVGLMSSLPVKGISLLLGNDLAGGKVVPSVQLTSKPSIEDESKLNLEFFPSCAVTRAMAKQAGEEENSVQSSTLLKHDLDLSGNRLDSGSSKSSCFNELSDTFLGAFFDQDVISSPQEVGNDLHVSDDLSLSRKQLITEQSSDPEIAELREKALPDEEIVKVPVGFYLKDGVLMRKWRPPDIPANEDWAVINQVVVPKVYRKDILTMAHSLPLGGHLGVNKTVNKIMKQFFWPGLRKDVANFCRTCHTCQVVGKHQFNPPVAPLKPIPAFVLKDEGHGQLRGRHSGSSARLIWHVLRWMPFLTQPSPIYLGLGPALRVAGDGFLTGNRTRVAAKTVVANEIDFNRTMVLSRDSRGITFKTCHHNVAYKNVCDGRTINCPACPKSQENRRSCMIYLLQTALTQERESDPDFVAAS
ncbi:hypothetical protein C0J50_19963 [Silurus asotus]|uniref:Gypsy retrotransposon integrase-like protein 1 n=1 Tax=Silurus asotus TaxID=30991 RepID=A0AAD5AQH3_SILAS|nr:hypothetical protein C0J50_19963 [Silurus asotus]